MEISINFNIIDNLIKNKSDLSYHHSSAIIKKNIAYAYNTNKLKGVISFHSEINSIINYLLIYNVFLTNEEIMNVFHNKSIKPEKLNKIRKIFKNTKIIVIRFDNEKELKESKPCLYCLKIIKYFNIKGVYYSSNDKILYEKSNEINNNTISNFFISF